MVFAGPRRPCTEAGFTCATNASPLSREVPQIEGYQIVGDTPLAESGMGVVWRAIQLGTRREVALKLIAAAYIGSDQMRRRFEREVELAASLDHSHIARVYESGLHRGLHDKTESR